MKLTYLLIRYPILQYIFSISVLLVYNCILNPNIAYAEWFNWISHTDSNPYPYDCWNAEYQIDNPKDITDYYEALQEYKNSTEAFEREIHLQNMYSSNDPMVNNIGDYVRTHKEATHLDIAALMPSIFQDPELFKYPLEDSETYKCFLVMCKETRHPVIICATAMYDAKVQVLNLYTHNAISLENVNTEYKTILAKMFERYSNEFNVILNQPVLPNSTESTSTGAGINPIVRDSEAEAEALAIVQIKEYVSELLLLSKHNYSITEIVHKLPDYRDESYRLPRGLEYINTFEYELLETEMVKTRDVNLIKVISVLAVNHLVHNEYPNMSEEHYFSLIERTVQLYIDKTAEVHGLK